MNQWADTSITRGCTVHQNIIFGPRKQKSVQYFNMRKEVGPLFVYFGFWAHSWYDRCQIKSSSVFQFFNSFIFLHKQVKIMCQHNDKNYIDGEKGPELVSSSLKLIFFISKIKNLQENIASRNCWNGNAAEWFYDHPKIKVITCLWLSLRREIWIHELHHDTGIM